MSGLEVADDEVWLDALGAMPQTEGASGNEYVRELVVTVSDSEEVVVTWDVTDSSVRVRHQRNGITVLDLYRELAARLTVVSAGSAREIVVEYGETDWVGRATVQVLPDVRVADSVLRT